jgi:tetratricopeptide (TPR) repeat protein
MKKFNKNNALATATQTVSKLLKSGRPREAVHFLQREASALGDTQIFHNMMGVAQAALREHDVAVRHFLKSIKINPLDPLPFSGIANSLAKNLQFDEAEKYYKLALVIDENYHDAIVGIGVINFQRSNYEACEDFFKNALKQKPQNSMVLANLANTYSVQGRYSEALPLWDRALKLNPTNAQARMNRGLAGLGMRRFDTAWDDYEDRFHEDNFIQERFKDLPKWIGPGKDTAPVLIWVEQGIGDEIMFASMYEELANLNEKFAAECNPRLLQTFKESFPHIFFLPTGSLRDHSAFKYQTSIASLGRVLRRSETSFERHRPKGGYLKQKDNTLHSLTSSALNALPRPWIGVSWESYALTKNFRERKSIPSTEFTEFTRGFKGSFINLQFPNPHKHEIQTQQAVPENVHTLPNLDLKNDLRGLTALLRQMDQVVTIGNSVAHLCGAFGIPTTVLLPSVADWRWGFSGDKSVWYESLTLYRNKDPNSWVSLLVELKEDLFGRYKN